MTVPRGPGPDDPRRDLTESAVDAVVSGAAFDALVERIAGLRPLAFGDGVPDDPLVRAEGLRYLLRFLAAGISICVEHDDTETPEFGRLIENRVSWGLDNPDTLYSFTRIRADATYRVTGWRGSACHLEFQVNTGHYADGDFTGWQAVSAVNGDELVTEPDGTFELVLSADPARLAGAPNGLRLDEHASFFVLRQYFDDWSDERPADVVIEQADCPYPPPPLTTDRMAAHLDLLGQWLDVGARCWDDISRGLLGAPPGDIQPFTPPATASGLKGQAYGFGAWRCRPDEAVVLSFEPPAARMWGLSLCDRFWQSIDFAARQSSLNSHQSVLEGGSFVGVISHDDPGVANWLDPAGHTEGTLAVRYLFPDALPPVRYRTVPRDALGDALPDGLTRVSPAERRAIMVERRAAVTRRYHR